MESKHRKDKDLLRYTMKRILKYILLSVVALVATLAVGIVFVIGILITPDEIVRQRNLLRITKVEFPPMKLGEYVLAESASGVTYWIAANLEEPPTENFLESIDKQLEEGNEYWKLEEEKYVFQKKGLQIVVKRGESRVWIELNELCFWWEVMD